MLIIGATGFLCKPLKKVLKAKDASRKGEIKIDLRKIDSLKKLKNFDVIVCCASKIGYTWLPWFQNYKSFYETNVKGIENLLKTVKAKYFVYISSLAVYDSYKLKKIKPKSFYGLTKYLAELKCKQYAKKKGFKLLIIRLPMVYDVKEPKREIWIFLKFGKFLKIFKPLIKRKKIRIISREEAIKKIAKLIREEKVGTINIKGEVINLYNFIKKLEKLKQIQKNFDNCF